MAHLDDKTIVFHGKSLDEFAENILELTGKPDGKGIDLVLDFDELEVLAYEFGLMRVGSSIHEAIVKAVGKRGLQADKRFDFDLMERRYMTR